jgi:hypothetical protein
MLGIGLASVYLLPMNANRSLFRLTNLLKVGPDIFDYRDHLFPFGATLFPAGRSSFRFVDVFSGVLGLVIVGISLVRLRQSRTSKLLLWAGVVCILATCAAPLVHRIGFVPHLEIASFRVIDVRSRVFTVTFLTLEAALLAYAALRQNAGLLSNYLLAAALACFFLETRWSDAIWRHVPLLWSIEFPWRLSGLLSAFTLGLIALALRDFWGFPSRRKTMLAIGAVLWLAIGISSYVVLGVRGYLARPFVTEIKRKLESPYAAYASVSRLPSLDELGPNDGLADRISLLECKGTAKLETVTARHLRLAVDCPQSCTLLVKLVYYPLWRAYEGLNHPIPMWPSKRAGLTEMSLGPGVHQVDLELPIGRSEVWGAWLSCISLIVAGFLCFSREGKGTGPAVRNVS